MSKALTLHCEDIILIFLALQVNENIKIYFIKEMRSERDLI